MHRPAQVFPLCGFLKEELFCRGWQAQDLCQGTWMSASRVEEILAGARISLKEAEALAARLGVSAALLLNLQMLWLQREGQESCT